MALCSVWSEIGMILDLYLMPKYLDSNTLVRIAQVGEKGWTHALTANAELSAEGIKVLNVYPGCTITSFRENALATPEIRQRDVGAQMPNGDTAEFVAEKILLAVQTEAIEQYMDR